MDLEKILLTNNYTRILYFIILVILNLKDNYRKTESFKYQYNFNIIMTPENKDQNIFDKEVYKTRTFTFEIDCNETGKDFMLVELHTFLNKRRLAFSNLKAYDGKLKVQNLYTPF